jgi:hypothetical protein
VTLPEEGLNALGALVNSTAEIRMKVRNEIIEDKDVTYFPF